MSSNTPVLFFISPFLPRSGNPAQLLSRRRARSTAISPNVRRLTPTRLWVYSISRSYIGKTCGRPLGGTVIAHPASYSRYTGGLTKPWAVGRLLHKHHQWQVIEVPAGRSPDQIRLFAVLQRSPSIQQPVWCGRCWSICCRPGRSRDRIHCASGWDHTRSHAFITARW